MEDVVDLRIVRKLQTKRNLAGLLRDDERTEVTTLELVRQPSCSGLLAVLLKFYQNFVADLEITNLVTSVCSLLHILHRFL